MSVRPTAARPAARASRPSRAARSTAPAPAPRGLWREVLAADPYALASQSPEWIDALCATGRYADASRVYESAAGAPMILPLVRRTGPWPSATAPRASMPPAWGMGGLLCGSPVERRDVEAVVCDLTGQPALRTTIRPNPLHAAPWSQAAGPDAITLPRRAHVLDLAAGADGVWARAPKLRRGVRKAERSGLEVRCGHDDEPVDAFHMLLGLSVQRWAAISTNRCARAPARATSRPGLEVRSPHRGVPGRVRIWIAYEKAVRRRDHRAPGARPPTRAARWTRSAAASPPTSSCTGSRSGGLRGRLPAYHMGETGSSASLARFKEKLGARTGRLCGVPLRALAAHPRGRRRASPVKRASGFAMRRAAASPTARRDRARRRRLRSRRRPRRSPRASPRRVERSSSARGSTARYGTRVIGGPTAAARSRPTTSSRAICPPRCGCAAAPAARGRATPGQASDGAGYRYVSGMISSGPGARAAAAVRLPLRAGRDPCARARRPGPLAGVLAAARRPGVQAGDRRHRDLRRRPRDRPDAPALPRRPEGVA